MNNNKNNIKLVIAIVGIIVVMYLVNEKIKKIQENKTKATIENAKRIFWFYQNDITNEITKDKEDKFIELYRNVINTDLHKKIYSALKKLSYKQELNDDDRESLKILYDNVVSKLKK